MPQCFGLFFHVQSGEAVQVLKRSAKSEGKRLMLESYRCLGLCVTDSHAPFLGLSLRF